MLLSEFEAFRPTVLLCILCVLMPSVAQADIIRFDSTWTVDSERNYDLPEEYFSTDNLFVSFVVDTTIGIDESISHPEEQPINHDFLISFALFSSLDGLAAFSTTPEQISASYVANAGCSGPSTDFGSHCGLLLSGSLASLNSNATVQFWLLFEQIFGYDGTGGLPRNPAGWTVEDLYTIDYAQFRLGWDDPVNGISFDRWYVTGNDYIATDLTPDGPVNVSEPGTLGILGFGLLALWRARKVKH